MKLSSIIRIELLVAGPLSQAVQNSCTKAIGKCESRLQYTDNFEPVEREATTSGSSGTTERPRRILPGGLSQD